MWTNDSDPSPYGFSVCDLEYFVFIGFRLFLVFPLSVLILSHGVQRWTQQRSSKAWSHSDTFTYNAGVLELIWTAGSVLSICGEHFKLSTLNALSFAIENFTVYGEMFFHFLTCWERYVAVCHPMIYRRLKAARGVRIRNASVGCCWILSGFWAVITERFTLAFNPLFPQLIVLLGLVSFCSVSTLCALIGPGPGERGGAREHADQSKRRALVTVLTITASVWVGAAGMLLTLVGSHAAAAAAAFGVACAVAIVQWWSSLPSTLALLLLYLYKNRKLACGS